jgi:uncharacterized protein
MTVPGAIRDLLACPRCHGPLTDRRDGRALDCTACSLRFPVRDGIPVMLLDQAERLAVPVS